MRRIGAILVTLVFVGGIAACRNKPDDAAITKDIQSKMAANPVTQDSQVAVTAHEGQVTLKGATKTAAAKREAVSMAKVEPGVKSVDDQTTIGQETASTEGPAGISAPAAIPRAVPPPPVPLVVPAGTIVTVRINQALSTKTVQTGTAFTGTVMTPITLGGKLAIPQGSDVTGIVSDAKKAGRFKGGASLTLALDSVTVKGHKYNIVTEYFARETKGKGKRTVGVIGGGAGVGVRSGDWPAVVKGRLLAPLLEQLRVPWSNDRESGYRIASRVCVDLQTRSAAYSQA